SKHAASRCAASMAPARPRITRRSWPSWANTTQALEYSARGPRRDLEDPMPTPARNTLAIVGAGPIGLEAALAALDRGLDAHVFERGEVGAHPRAWGHVRMFTPWRM